MRLLIALLPLFVCASFASAQNEFLNPSGISPAAGYSHVVVAHGGKTIFVSGQVARDAAGQLVGKGDLRAQTKQVFENLEAALAGAGATMNDVVKITWYVKDYKPEYLPTLREVRDSYVNKKSPPASTLVGVSALFQNEYLLEVEAIAVVADKQK